LVEFLGETAARFARRQRVVPHERSQPLHDLGDLEQPLDTGQVDASVVNETLDELQRENRIIFRYSDECGNLTPNANPNGSLDNIAGICNRERNVLGMMPHPERASELLLGSSDGRIIFYSLADTLAELAKAS